MKKELFFELTQSEYCEYYLSKVLPFTQNSFGDYLRPFRVEPYRYKIVSSAQLVSPRLIGIEGHKIILSETLPFLNLPRRTKWTLRLKSLIPSVYHINGCVSCLLDYTNWHNSYFHWFFECLPRVCAAKHFRLETNKKVRLLVPSSMKEFQITSLRMLGFHELDWIPINPQLINTSIKVDQLIAAPSARIQSQTGIPYDAICPGVVHLLSKNLTKFINDKKTTLKPKKILISREDASTRRILNQHEIYEFLKDFGFQLVCLDGMPLKDQIELFYNASHIVSPHGGGLTNLMFAKNASILEIHSSNHGVRPEFFQLSSIKNLKYYHYVTSSLNNSNDFELPISVLKTFLRQSLI